MLAISPSSPLFSNYNFGSWILDELYTPAHLETSNSAVALHSSSQKLLQHCDSSNKFDHQIINGGDHHNQPDQMVKKINHNASECDRRRKINSLYSSLRSLLPASEHTKRLSIPSTVSRILSYIPELRNEVEILIQKKEELTSTTISNNENSANSTKKKRRGGIERSSLIISASEIGDKEVVVQVYTLKINKDSIAEAVSKLEDEGLLLLNASSFETFEDRVEGAMAVEADTLREKLSSYFENEDNLLP